MTHPLPALLTAYVLTVYGFTTDHGHMANLGSLVFLLPEDSYPTLAECEAAGDKRVKALQSPIQPNATRLLGAYTCEERK